MFIESGSKWTSRSGKVAQIERPGLAWVKLTSAGLILSCLKYRSEELQLDRAGRHKSQLLGFLMSGPGPACRFEPREKKSCVLRIASSGIELTAVPTEQSGRRADAPAMWRVYLDGRPAKVLDHVSTNRTTDSSVKPQT